MGRQYILRSKATPESHAASLISRARTRKWKGYVSSSPSLSDSLLCLERSELLAATDVPRPYFFLESRVADALDSDCLELFSRGLVEGCTFLCKENIEAEVHMIH